MSAKRVLPDGMRELLGTMPDSSIGKQFGMCGSGVGTIRKGLGIAPYSPVPAWPAEAIEQLGKRPDSKIGEQFGFTRLQVRSERISRGIPVFLKKQGTSPNKHRPTAKTSYAWPPEAIALLGSMPDSKVATQLAITHRCVQEKRQMLGISAYKATPAYEGKLGTMPDAALAAECGCTRRAIWRARTEKNIPAAGRAGRRSRVWSAEEIALIGVHRDSAVAGMLGISRRIVERKRQQLSVAKQQDGET